ncbi:unnamed protein product [Vicia faba]|uniref:ABC transporter domain-containing protein n=1 Tax=Vicia faba TaxID=3906 RepID=A0AAV0ZEE7_VICFA|nr:unnamed protein product [Vicia faba]
MGWSRCCQSRESKGRRYNNCSDEYSFWCHIYAAPDLQIFNQAKAKVFQVIQRKPLIHNESKRNIHTKISSYIELQDVHFSYPSRPEKYILQGLSLSIPAGKTVALVGSSGCGKSTAISLVTRFYDPTRGEILMTVTISRTLICNFNFTIWYISYINNEIFAAVVTDE